MSERQRVLHLIDAVAAAGEEIVIRVRQQNTDQVNITTATPAATPADVPNLTLYKYYIVALLHY